MTWYWPPTRSPGPSRGVKEKRARHWRQNPSGRPGRSPRARPTGLSQLEQKRSSSWTSATRMTAARGRPPGQQGPRRDRVRAVFPRSGGCGPVGIPGAQPSGPTSRCVPTTGAGEAQNPVVVAARAAAIAGAATPLRELDTGGAGAALGGGTTRRRVPGRSAARVAVAISDPPVTPRNAQAVVPWQAEELPGAGGGCPGALGLRTA